MPEAALLELRELVLRDGYHPAVQLAGYLQTGDPSYLPPGKARRLAAGLAHDLLLQTVAEVFLKTAEEVIAGAMQHPEAQCLSQS